MLDNLRSQTSFQPEENEPLDSSMPQQPKPRKPRRTFDQIIGMNAKQRLMIAVMLLVMVCLLGVTLLLFTGKVVLPFTF